MQGNEFNNSIHQVLEEIVSIKYAPEKLSEHYFEVILEKIEESIIIAKATRKKVLQNIFGEVKEDERGERELPSGNDRPTMRSLTQRSPKR